MRLYVFMFFLIVASLVYGQFTEINTGLLSIGQGSSVWGDYDNDGDLDILLTGGSDSGLFSKVYRNDGNNTFIDINAGLIGVAASSAAWGDYDNDGDLDILLTGYTGVGSINISKVYHNNGNNTFTDIVAGITGVRDGSSAWGDYDNDGDLDILITGEAGTYDVSKVYRNDGNGIFTDVYANLLSVCQSSIAWGDYDNDGDLDILLTGINQYQGYISKIYRNDDNGVFTDISAGLVGVRYSSVSWGDYDNDGDLDILLTGMTANITYISKIYRNDGDGIFVDINSNLPGIYWGSVAWGDYDNDGDLDILMTGEDSSKVFRNDGNGIFTNISASLAGVIISSAVWGDFDNDGDLDILISGVRTNSGWVYITKVYRNDIITSNAIPAMPTNLRTSILGNYVNFQWDAAIDVQTPIMGLNYILRIGNSHSGCQIASPMANTNGYRLIPMKGFSNGNCSWKILRSALPDRFYWSVQAIDGAYAGSNFAAEQGYNIQPEITLLTLQPLQYGNFPINGFSNWSGVIIQNNNWVNLSINDLHFREENSHFNCSYPNLGNPIYPGEIDTILVRFAPTLIGTVDDTLYIESNAVNTPVLKIHLSGTGTYVPPSPPQNVNVLMQSYNALVSWDAVTTDIHGNAIVPDCYIVLYNETPFEDSQLYYYLDYTDQLSYSHHGVGRFRPQMYYRVVAYKDYGRGNLDRLREFITSGRKVRYSDLGF